MNKINSAGLNLINRVTENKENEKLVTKNQIIEEQKNVLYYFRHQIYYMVL